MPINYQTFLTQLTEAIQSQSGPNLAYLLRPTSPHGRDLVKEFRNPTRESLSYCEGSLESPWDEIAIQFVLVCHRVAKKRQIEAFKEEAQLVSLFFRYFTNNSGWTLPALFSILRDLRDLAFDADVQARYNNERCDSMEEAARIIAKAFGNCMTDRTSPPQESRKWGIYYVVSLVLKCYFRLRKISLSKNILRALEANPEIPPLSSYPRSHQVTYRYYIGMLSFLNEEYAKSEQELTLAFYHCHIGAQANQQRILTYLIPLRILRGHLPTAELLQRFPALAELYTPFINSIRKGDLRAYDAELERCSTKLVEAGLWVVVEKGREKCLRGLFRRVWAILSKPTRVPLSVFNSALRLSGVEASLDEAECLVAVMIYKGYVRGYISHEKRMVVLASTNAFPRVSERPATAWAEV